MPSVLTYLKISHTATFLWHSKTLLFLESDFQLPCSDYFGLELWNTTCYEKEKAAKDCTLLTPETNKQTNAKGTYNSFSPKKLVYNQTEFSNRLIKADSGFISVFRQSLEQISIFAFLLAEKTKVKNFPLHITFSIVTKVQLQNYD